MTRTSKTLGILLAVCIGSVIFGAGTIRGQSAPPTQIGASNDTGLQPHVPYSIGVGNVNLTNGNLTLELPLVNLPGRGGRGLNLALQYDSKNWIPHYMTSNGMTTHYIVYTWQVEKRDPQVGSMGWRLNSPVAVQGGWETDANGNQTGYLPDVVILKDGSKHSLGEIRFASGQSLDSEDGSSLIIDTSAGAVRTKSGDVMYFPELSAAQSKTIDPNGNVFYGDDALGRSFVITNTGYIGGPYYGGSFPHLIQYKDSNGVLQTITLNYTTPVLNPTFGLPQASSGPVNAVIVHQPPANEQYPLLTSVQLPDSTQYTFSYNGYGELTQITFPTGGYAQYTYGVFTHTENIWEEAGLPMQADFREVTSRTVCDNNGTCGTTTYTPGTIYVINNWMNVLEPDGHLTVHSFSQVTPFNDPCDRYYTPRELATYVYAGATTSTPLLRTISTTYNSYAGSNCSDHYLPTMIATYLNDVGSTPLVKKEEFDYDTYTAHVFAPMGIDPVAQTAQDVSVPIDNVIAHREYDYGSGAPGLLIRTTQTDWLKTTYYTGRYAHILDRKTRVAVLDSTGAKKSETKYEYDNYTEGLSASGAVNHQSAGNVRGNLTAIDTWLNTTNSYLETRFQYDDAGNAIKAKDPKGNITLMSYADNWNTATNACPAKDVSTNTTGPGAAYLTSVQNAMGHISLAQYNSCTGTMASATDPNLQTKSFTYDFFGRPTDIRYPDTGEILLSYQGATTVQRQLKQTSSAWIANYTYFDGLGRTKQTQLVDPQGDDFVDTSYDALGRTASVSNPHRSTALPTDGITAYRYDVLGRACVVIPPDGSTPPGNTCPTTAPANTVFTSYLGNCTTVTDQAGKARKSCVDGLGRLTQVFEPTASGALTVETDYQYDVLDNLTRVDQKGGTTDSAQWRTRTFSYNSLSQLMSASNPESGTVSYTYDADGNVLTKTAPAPNQTGTATVTTTYSYDAINRVISKTYSDSTAPVSYFFDGGFPASIGGSTATPGRGSGTTNGSEQSVGSGSGSPGIGRVTINGTEGVVDGCAGGMARTASASSGVSPQSIACPVYDTGTVSITVNGSTTETVSYGQGSTGSSLARALANAFNGDGSSPVTATASGNVVTLTARTNGAGTNYPLSVSSATTNTDYFSAPSFTPARSGATLTGGTNGIVYDIGTVWLTVNGCRMTAPYQQGSTTATVAGALVTSINGTECSPVSAQLSGSTVNLTAKISGASTNYSLAGGSATSLPGTFSRPSFTVSVSGAALTGGTNGTIGSLVLSNVVGRRTGMSDAAGSEAWSYDSVGRVASDVRKTNSVTKTSSYTYNLDGSLYTLTYPTGRIVTYGHNGAGRLLSAVDTPNSISYATGAHYAPTGALDSLANGASVVSTLFYDKRLQPCRISVKNTGVAPANCADTASPGNILDLSYDFSLGATDNGSVTAITNNRDPNRSQRFAYDALNRIATAKTASTSGSKCWDESFGYDPWGNLLSIGRIAGYTCSNEELLNVIATTKNQVSAFIYDSAGNLIQNPGVASYTYDAENHLLTAGGVTYTYDGDGRRVMKSNGKLYWYGSGSDPLDETDPAGNINNASFKEYVFFGGKRIARRDSANSVNYYFADHLGSARVVTNSSGTLLDDSDFYPFGGERPSTPPTPSSGNNYKFTGKERDTESGLDNFGARYDSSALGRFMSPDSPSYSNRRNPQSWNLYAYALNNPTSFRDPDGHEVVCNNNPEQCKKNAADSTANAKAADRVKIKTTIQHHKLWFLKWDTTKTTIAIDGDINSFRNLGINAAKLADLVTSERTVTVYYGKTDKPLYTIWDTATELVGGSNSNPRTGGAVIDPTRIKDVIYDRDAINEGVSQSNTAEEFAHEVLGHIWGDWFGGAPGGTKGNLRDSIAAEDEVRRYLGHGQKGIESHHDYQEAPDPPGPDD